VPHSGWPITRDQLSPYYERARELLAVPAYSFSDDVWRVIGTRALPVDPQLLLHAVIAFSPRPHRFPAGMLRRDLERSQMIRILLHATATELRLDPSRAAVDKLEVKTPTGSRATVRAKTFLLCGGGIENARLLLASRRDHPEGVGNRNDVVGRYYQDHPVGTLAALSTNHPQLIQEAYGVFYRGRLRHNPRIRLSPELQRREGVLNCAASVVSAIGSDSGEEALLRLFHALRGRRLPSGAGRDVARFLRDAPSTARFVGRYLRGKPSVTMPTGISLLSMAEQQPNPDSRMTLADSDDALGVPRVRLDWRLTDLDRRTLEVMARTVRAEFERLGVAQVEVAPWLMNEREPWTGHIAGPFHPTGTTRMATDPARGVVDATCRVHGVGNLYIAGSSVFPTSGYANPTFTIIALAIRLADQLKTGLK
jgi:choline dehydrogenase-like flavoprotein